MRKEKFNMENFILPERWVVRAINNEEDHIIVPYINNTFKTKIDIGLTYATTPWFYSNTQNEQNIHKPKHDGSSLKSFPSCKEITFDEFVKYIINKENITHKQNEEYNKILINLLTDG